MLLKNMCSANSSSGLKPMKAHGDGALDMNGAVYKCAKVCTPSGEAREGRPEVIEL
jgi:hypothetical protein